MGSTLMATTAILISCGLAAILSSTYSIKKPLNDSVFGAHGEFMLSLKYVSILTIFLFSFLCHSLSIRFINQVNVLINTPQEPMSPVTPKYVSQLFEKGCVLNTVGNRLFYSAVPLLLWIFGPVLVFLCYLSLLPLLYNLDFVSCSAHTKNNTTKVEANNGIVVGNENFVQITSFRTTTSMRLIYVSNLSPPIFLLLSILICTYSLVFFRTWKLLPKF